MANLVEELEQVQAVGDLLLVLGDDLDGDALFKVDGELVRLVGGVDGVKGAAGRVSAVLLGGMGVSRPELLGRGVVGVLEDAGLVRAVDKVVWNRLERVQSMGCRRAYHPCSMAPWGTTRRECCSLRHT